MFAKCSREFIGKHIKIINSKNPFEVGLEGNVVDETFHLLTVKNGSKLRNLFKKNLIFSLQIDDKTIIIDGKKIEKRSEDRLKVI